MVVAVNDSRAEFRADLVKLVAESGHLVSAVFVAGDDLVDRVDDDSDVILLQRAADQLRRELVHRYGMTAQIPDINVSDAPRLPAHRLVDVAEAVQAARTVKLKIDIQNSALAALPIQPFLPLGNGAAQLDKCIGLTGL